MTQSNGYAALEAGGPLVPFEFERRDPGSSDIVIEIRYCGICHSDIHAVENDWGFHGYPLVPGHEIVGTVVAIGPGVTRHRLGDWVGVGTVIDSCRHCSPCTRGLESYCAEGPSPTFGGADRQGRMTFGGFSNNYVIDESYALRIPPALDPATAAPLLCAGITTYSPLNRAKLQKSQKVGIVGLGGLGHLAVKWARAWGTHVVVFSSSVTKAAEALRLGADEVVIAEDASQLSALRGTFPIILDTVSAAHDIDTYINLLELDGTLCLLGMPPEPLKVSSMPLAVGRRVVTSSMTGGIAETEEMLAFAAQHGISADVEILPIESINEAFQRLRRQEVRYRFVLDMSGLVAAPGTFRPGR